jgi:nucleoside-diphosphate-sugar epimerase
MLTNEDVILITGGSGFIGTNLIEAFEESEYTIINFDKNPPVKQSQEVYWHQGNIMNSEDLKSVFNRYQPTVVIHLAARTDTLSNKLDDYTENIEGTKNIIEEVKKHDCVKHVVITSTQYVYKSKEMPFSSKDDDYNPHTVYGESKRIAEEITKRSGMKCKWTIVRPCNVWGPWHMRYPDELWKVIAKGFYVHPSKKPVIRTYAYVKNLVHQLTGILNAEDLAVNRKVFYLGDMPIDSYLWLNELSLQLRRKNIIRIPKLFFWVGAIAGDIIRHMFRVNFPLYSVRYHNMIEDFYAPGNVTIHLFGTYNDNLASNVRETVEWLETEGKNYFEYWGTRTSFNIT